MTPLELQQGAHEAVAAAVRAGLFPRVRTIKCADCKAPARVYHHYAGYDVKQWLTVVALCHRCHLKKHPNALYLLTHSTKRKAKRRKARR